MDSNDPFMKAAEGRFPLSENPGAARYWVGSDGGPRPDRKYWWLAVISIVLGVFGADHFYLRSPKTGFLKMLTFGGFGLWWIWDVAQILFEKERIMAYGMSTPLDITTGIAQGMITDKATQYKSNASYGLWTWSTIFGFLGLDSMLVLKNMGQGMRKFLEGILFIGSLASIISLGVVGLPHGFFAKIGAILGGVVAALGVVIFGTMIGVQWFITIRQALSPPENLFQEGIKLTEAEDKQVNALVSWLMKNTDLSAERKEQIIQDLKYGSMMPERVRAMFQIYHPSEGAPIIPTDKAKGEENPGSLASFFTYLGSPINIWWLWVRTAVWLAKEGVASVNQPAYSIGKIMEMFTKFISPETLQQLASPENMKGMVSGAVKSMPMVGEPLAAALEGKPPGKALAAAAQGVVGQAKEAVGGVVAGVAQQASEGVGAVTNIAGLMNKGGAAELAQQASEGVGAVTNIAGLMNKGGVAELAQNVVPEKVQRLASIMRDVRRLVPGTGERDIARIASTIYQQNPNITTPELETLAERYKGQYAMRPELPESNSAYRAAQQMKDMSRMPAAVMVGGARSESLSLEGKLMGATTIALICGGAVKFIIDNLISE